jgi:hypothetical protein
MQFAGSASEKTSFRTVTRYGLGACFVALLIVAAASGCKKPVERECINLVPYCTAQLTTPLNCPASLQRNNLAALRSGRHTFAGIPFQVGGVLQLSGKKLQEWQRTEFPESVKDIRIGRPIRRLHLLHGAGCIYDPEGTTIARLILHYADNSEKTLEIYAGLHVRDWWGDPAQPLADLNSALAWTGTNPAIKEHGGNKSTSLRVYRSTFELPASKVPVATIDYQSTMKNSSPFLLGLTVE